MSQDPKMIPGQKPYTEEEQEQLDDLFRAALEAEEMFDLDELEEFAAEQKRKERDDASYGA